jgi:hypothetical protein
MRDFDGRLGRKKCTRKIRGFLWITPLHISAGRANSTLFLDKEVIRKLLENAESPAYVIF